METPHPRDKTGTRVLVAAAVAAALLLGVVTWRLVTQYDPAPPMPTGAELAQAQEPPTKSLSRFYTQDLQWSTCNGMHSCARLTVPADYDAPRGEVTTLQVVRAPATQGGERIGALIVAPGGPGLSAVDFVLGTPVTPRISERFDVVGLDRRGTGRSTPLRCVGDAGHDAWLGTSPELGDRSLKTLQRELGAYAAGCRDSYGDGLDDLGSDTYAKDLDVLRSALGEKRLHLLAYSYGTYVAQWYMSEFPDRVGRFVLDGVIPMGSTNADLNAGQAVGFEATTTRFLRHCVDAGACPLGESVPQARRGLIDFLDGSPTATVSGDPRVHDLTPGWRRQAVLGALYTRESWGALTEAIEAAQGGDGDPMMDLASLMVGRNDDGTYRSNVMQVINAVTCLDRSSRDELVDVQADASALAAAAPVWGGYMGWQTALCTQWPVEPVEQPNTPRDPDVPVMVVGTSNDPATPLVWSRMLAARLDQSTLVTLNGDGHTAYRRDDCVDDAVDGYLLTGSTPGDHIRCGENDQDQNLP